MWLAALGAAALAAADLRDAGGWAGEHETQTTEVGDGNPRPVVATPWDGDDAARGRAWSWSLKGKLNESLLVDDWATVADPTDANNSRVTQFMRYWDETAPDRAADPRGGLGPLYTHMLALEPGDGMATPPNYAASIEMLRARVANYWETLDSIEAEAKAHAVELALKNQAIAAARAALDNPGAATGGVVESGNAPATAAPAGPLPAAVQAQVDRIAVGIQGLKDAIAAYAS